MASKTTTTRKRTTTATKRPKLVNDGLPKRRGKGGKVTRHGVTTTGYQRGCRCDLCRAAAVEYKRNLRERKRQAETKTTRAATPKAPPTREAHRRREGNYQPPPEHQDELALTHTRHHSEPVLSQTGSPCLCRCCTGP
jgi:hypothetical protein